MVQTLGPVHKAGRVTLPLLKCAAVFSLVILDECLTSGSEPTEFMNVLVPWCAYFRGIQAIFSLIWSIVSATTLLALSHTRRNKRAYLSLFAISVEDTVSCKFYLSLICVYGLPRFLQRAIKGVESIVPFVVPLLVAK